MTHSTFCLEASLNNLAPSLDLAAPDQPLLDSCSDCVLTLTEQGCLAAVNLAGQRLLTGAKGDPTSLLGLPLHQVLGLPVLGDTESAFADLVARFYREGSLMLRGRNSWERELSLQWVGTELTTSGFRLLLKDASLTQPFRDELVSLREQMQVALFAVTDGVITTDAKGVIQFMNPTARNLLKVSGHAGLGVELAQLFTLFDSESNKPLDCPVQEALRRGRLANVVDGAALYVSGDSPVPVSAVAAPYRNSQRQIDGCVLVFRDTTSNRRVSARMNWQAEHDGLTQLPNRVHFETELAREVGRAKAGNGTHGLLVVDIYQFRVVNQTFGQAAGDQLLIQLAQVFAKVLRSQDLLARIGSDEFGILLRGATVAGAQRVADMLIEAVKKQEFVWQGRSTKPAICVGAMTIDAEVESECQALAATTAACEAAKENGRNRIHLHHSLNRAEVERRRTEMQWVNKITSALAEDRLLLYAQPVVAVNQPDACAQHFEVLVRLRDGDSVIPPGQFLPAAERFGLMDEIDRTVLMKVIEFIAEHPHSAQSFAVNVSGTTLSDDCFADFVLSELRASGIDARRLHFEITETAAMGNLSAVVRLMTQLKALGCQFYLDDFGSGLSSLAYLKGLPVDYLKIDGSFVRAMTPDSTDYAMVSTMNHLAGVLGLKTVAEYVENAEVLALLQTIGVDYAQGYFFAEPQPMHQLVEPG